MSIGAATPGAIRAEPSITNAVLQQHRHQLIMHVQ